MWRAMASEPLHSARLLDQFRSALRVRHRSPRTEEAYVYWVRRFLEIHPTRHPHDLGRAEISQFLSTLASVDHVSASTQVQALSALVFLYKHVLRVPFEWLDGLERARKPIRLPIVLSRREVAAVLAELARVQGPYWILASLLYGSGLRLLEACQLRIKDLDLDRHELTVRSGKGNKDRRTMIAQHLIQPLQDHLRHRFYLHEQDLTSNQGSVALPNALDRKLSSASTDWAWQQGDCIKNSMISIAWRALWRQVL